MADAPDTKADEAEPPEKKKSKVVAFAVSAVFLIGSAVTVGMLAFPSDKAQEEEEEEPKVTSVLPIPQILVNLSKSDSQRLLQATMSIEAKAVTEAVITDRLNTDMPKVQDLMIRVLSAYTATDLEGGSKKQAVQVRLINYLNEELFSDGDIEISSVYFTEFVVQ